MASVIAAPITVGAPPTGGNLYPTLPWKNLLSLGCPVNRVLALCGVVLCVNVSSAAAQPVSCSAQKIGQTTYTSCSDGSRATTQRIGSSSYSTYSDGSTSTTQRIGSSSYYNDSRGGTGSSQRIGSSTYSSYSFGEERVNMSSQRIGGTTYTDGRSSSGSSFSGSSQRIGTTTYGTTTVRSPASSRYTGYPYDPPKYP